MRTPSYIFFVIVVSIAAWTVMSVAPAAPQPSLAAVTAAVPAFLQNANSRTVATPPQHAAPTQNLGITSAIPPGPPPGTVCSVDAAGQNCSAFGPSERCSALNAQNGFCSTTPPANGLICSSFNANAACSVLPTQQPPIAPSGCSAIGNGQAPPNTCSAVGQARRQLCSTKGQGSSLCSAFDPVSQCSVFNQGAAARSFCSTKFNQPTTSKACSAFFDFVDCSVIAGGSGVCTTFGAAVPASCSAFSANAFCSVIPGLPGNPCVQ